MADKADDGTIELDLSIPDDNKKAATDKKAATPEVKVADAPPVDDALAVLKKQLDDEKAGRANDQAKLRAAEDTIRQASDTSVKAQTEARTANLSMVEGAITSVKREQEVLESNLANAMGAGDFAAAAKIQTHIATAATKLVQLETGKEAMEAEAKHPIKRVDPPRDPVEALASALSPRSAAWVRAHPECATNQRLFDRMVGADKIVRSDGIAPDTDEYFEKVEEIMGFRKPVADDNTDPMGDAAQVTQRRSGAPPAAPVSRSGTANGQRPNTVRLNAEEREIAAMNGMTDREYAEQKAKLIKEGRLN